MLTTQSLRASSYNIYVDLPSDQPNALLVHGYTGAYDIVSREVCAYVRSLEASPPPKPLYGQWEVEPSTLPRGYRPADITLATLARRGYLTDKSIAEEEALFVKIVNNLHRSQTQSSSLSYIVMPTYSCNLRCAYCFQDHMRTDLTYSHLLRTMSTEMADRILSAIPNIENLHLPSADSDQPRSFTFFGGEPLLRESFPLIQYFMQRARLDGRASFGAITNGTDLDAYQEVLGPNGIAFLQITLDGPRDLHDERRIYADKSGSFEKISRNISMALDMGVEVSVRINVDRRNIASLPELADHYIRAGWTGHDNFSAYVAPITDAEVHNGGRRHELFNSWELSDAMASLRLNHESIAAISPVDDALKQRALDIFNSGASGFSTRTSFCGAHTGMYIFDAFGDIYACWEKTGEKNLRVGFIDNAGKVTLKGLNEHWRQRTVATNSTCRRCRFALHCGGGCAILAEAASGTMYSNYCDAFGKRFRGKIAEAFADYAKGAAQDERGVRSAHMQEFVR